MVAPLSNYASVEWRAVIYLFWSDVKTYETFRIFANSAEVAVQGGYFAP
jgi:hypothetical protein